MFGFFKKKKKCECNKECECNKVTGVVINEVCVTDNDTTALDHLLYTLLSPIVNQIIKDVLNQPDQNKAFKDFDALVKMDDDFSARHIAALILQNDIIREGDKKEKAKAKKNNVKKGHKTLSSSSSKKNSSEVSKKK